MTSPQALLDSFETERKAAAGEFGRSELAAALARYAGIIATACQAAAPQVRPVGAIGVTTAGLPNTGAAASTTVQVSVYAAPQLPAVVRSMAALAYSNVAAIVAAAQRWEQSRAFAFLATQMQPDYARAWSRLGLALENLRCYEEAVEAHTSAAAIAERLGTTITTTSPRAASSGDDRSIDLNNVADPAGRQALAAAAAKYRGDAAVAQEQVAQRRGIVTDALRLRQYVRRDAAQGTEAMKAAKYKDAAALFGKALQRCQEAEAALAARGDPVAALTQAPPLPTEERAALHANCSAALARVAAAMAASGTANAAELLSTSQNALREAQASVRANPAYARGHTRVAVAHTLLEEFEAARAAVAAALRLAPADKAALDAEAELTNAEARDVARRDAEAVRVRELRAAAERAARAARGGENEDEATRLAAERARDEARAEALEARGGAVGPVSVGLKSGSYSTCRFCSQLGHTANNCPLRFGAAAAGGAGARRARSPQPK